MAPSLEERIWARIPRGEPDACWIWTGNFGQKGGPTIHLGGRKQGSARRPLWEMTRGVILPRNRQVATTCKVPQCMNPAHLYLRPWTDDPARFWSHVDKTPGYGPNGDCWRWTSTQFVAGYGAFKMKGKERQAHRVSYELANGIIAGHVPHTETERVVMHSCDMPLCVNPAHLSLGTDADNIRDMFAKGRAASQKDPKGVAAQLARAQRRRTDTDEASTDSSKNRP